MVDEEPNVPIVVDYGTRSVRVLALLLLFKSLCFLMGNMILQSLFRFLECVFLISKIYISVLEAGGICWRR